MPWGGGGDMLLSFIFDRLKYPLQIVSVPLPDKMQHLYVPDVQAVKSLYASGGLASFPYWAAIWPSAVALGMYLQKHPELVAGKSVLEIAAGLGLPSLVAAKTALHVHCTDIDADAVEITRQSAVLNGLTNLQFDCLDWNHAALVIKPDILLLSDVNYESAAFPGLLQLIKSMLMDGVLVLLATPQRLMAKPFIEELALYCRHHEVIAAATPDGRLADISVFMISAS